MSDVIKTCFIIMPISDGLDYSSDHFKRVYDFLIKPACEKAGFKPIRADDVVTTNYIAIDILKKIISSEMAMCDLSSRNPNVLYELGIRQAFNLPVTLIKDTVTKRVFDIQGFRDFEYDETLRIDNVNENISALADVIFTTYENKNKEINSLISLLGIEPAKIFETREISTGTELILNSLSSIENRLLNLENKNDSKKPTTTIVQQHDSKLEYVSGLEMKEGMRINHSKFGEGTVLKIDNSSIDKKAVIKFDQVGQKTLLMSFIKVAILNS